MLSSHTHSTFQHDLAHAQQSKKDAHTARMIRCAHCGCIIKNSEAVSPEMPTSGVYEELLVCKECAEQEKRDIDRMEKEYNEKRNADKMQTVYDDYMQLQPLPLKDSP